MYPRPPEPSDIAHPIIGDATHGKGPLNRAVADWLGAQRLWLHVSLLTLQHPVSGQALHIEATRGSDWAVWRSGPSHPAPLDSPGQAKG